MGRPLFDALRVASTPWTTDTDEFTDEFTDELGRR
jgi:hypothetical protein